MLRHSEIETTMIYLPQWNRVKKAAEKLLLKFKTLEPGEAVDGAAYQADLNVLIKEKRLR